MTAFRFGLCATAMIFASCTRYSGPPLSASDVVIFAPLPGRTTSVAYMTLQNHGDQKIVLKGAFSPGFNRVEMHETTITDGIARMHKLDSLEIEGHASISFATGGKHFMLIEPKTEHRPGDLITLQVRFDEGGVLTVQAPVQSRSVN